MLKAFISAHRNISIASSLSNAGHFAYGRPRQSILGLTDAKEMKQKARLYAFSAIT